MLRPVTDQTLRGFREGEPVQGDGQRKHPGPGSVGAGLIGIDPAEAGGAQLRGLGNWSITSSASKSMSTSEHAGEPSERDSEPGRDC